MKTELILQYTYDELDVTFGDYKNESVSLYFKRIGIDFVFESHPNYNRIIKMLGKIK